MNTTIKRRIIFDPPAVIARDYALLTIGAICLALAVDLFLVPNNVVVGGVTGIAILLNTLLGLPVGVTSLVLNIPLFVLGFRALGGFVFGVRTIYATVVMSLAIDLLARPVSAYVVRDPLLYTFYGGLLAGFGTGLVFRARGTTGGTDVLARWLQQRRGIRVGQATLAMSAVVFGLAGGIYGATPVLYALLVTFIESRAIDVVVDGVGFARSALIISQEPEQVRAVVLSELGRGLTILEGRGGYTDTEQAVLYCVISQAEIVTLKRLIAQIDPNAFVVIAEAAEVLGEGFRALGTK